MPSTIASALVPRLEEEKTVMSKARDKWIKRHSEILGSSAEFMEIGTASRMHTSRVLAPFSICSSQLCDVGFASQMWLNCLNVHRSKDEQGVIFWCSIQFMNQLKCYQPELSSSQLFLDFDGFPVSCFHSVPHVSLLQLDLKVLGDPQAPTWRRLVVGERPLPWPCGKKASQKASAAPDRDSCIMWKRVVFVYLFVSHIIHISTTETRETKLRLHWNHINYTYMKVYDIYILFIMWCMVYILAMNRYDILVIFDILGPCKELIEKLHHSVQSCSLGGASDNTLHGRSRGRLRLWVAAMSVKFQRIWEMRQFDCTW